MEHLESLTEITMAPMSEVQDLSSQSHRASDINIHLFLMIKITLRLILDHTSNQDRLLLSIQVLHKEHQSPGTRINKTRTQLGLSKEGLRLSLFMRSMSLQRES